MNSLTQNQILALVDLRDGQLRYGIHLRGRYALPSLKRRGLVYHIYGDGTADQWTISPAGIDAVNAHATIAHLKRTP